MAEKEKVKTVAKEVDVNTQIATIGNDLKTLAKDVAKITEAFNSETKVIFKANADLESKLEGFESKITELSEGLKKLEDVPANPTDMAKALEKATETIAKLDKRLKKLEDCDCHKKGGKTVSVKETKLDNAPKDLSFKFTPEGGKEAVYEFKNKHFQNPLNLQQTIYVSDLLVKGGGTLEDDCDPKMIEKLIKVGVAVSTTGMKK